MKLNNMREYTSTRPWRFVSSQWVTHSRHRAKIKQQIDWIICNMAWWGLRPFGSFNLSSPPSSTECDAVTAHVHTEERFRVWSWGKSTNSCQSPVTTAWFHLFPLTQCAHYKLSNLELTQFLQICLAPWNYRRPIIIVEFDDWGKKNKCRELRLYMRRPCTNCSVTFH